MNVFPIHRGLLHIAGKGQDYHLAFLPGSVSLVGTPGHQFFTLPTKESVETDYFRLSVWFQTKEKLAAAAELWREGHTNRDRFFASIEELRNQKKVSDAQRNQLRAFIMKCDCGPSVVRKKLVPLGFGNLNIDFEDPDPRFEATVDALWDLILWQRKNDEASQKG